jgi:FixJ family two-component response regulator
VARPSKLTPEIEARLREIATIRERNTTNKSLANELGISQRAIEYHLARFLRKKHVSRETVNQQNALPSKEPHARAAQS